MKKIKEKYNHYHCLDCNEKWEDTWEEQYGDVDDECPSCGKDYSPTVFEIICNYESE